MERIPPSRKLRQEAEALLKGCEMNGHPLDAFVRLEEVAEFLGRAHYQRGGRRCRGWRNGYEPGKVWTAEGMLEIALPRVRRLRTSPGASGSTTQERSQQSKHD